MSAKKENESIDKYTRSLLVTRTIVVHDGKLLLIRRSESDSNSGNYEFPGGMVDKGESLEQAAVRELVEETGISVSISDLDFYISHAYEPEPGVDRLTTVFVVIVNSDKVTLSWEHDDHLWATPEHIKNLQMHERYYEWFPKVFKDIVGENTTTTSGGEVKNTSVQEVKDQYDELHIFTDGGSRGNPGPSATGYVIMNKDEQVIAEGGTYLGITTNNQAEYRAVTEALLAAKKFKPKKILFFLDSMLAVRQIKGEWKVKNADLKPVHAEIIDLMKDFDSVEFSHVRRKYNTLADAEVNKVLDDVEAQNPA